MAGTRKTAVISYKELSDSESDTFKHRHPTDLKRRKRKKNKKLHVKNVAPTEGTLTKSITPPWAVFPLDIIHEVGALLGNNSKHLKPLIMMLGFRYFDGYNPLIFFNLQDLPERYVITS
ncbi:hypothetical protein FRB94_003939 [Tulasnella sp. JGI-2019a]|nr:hypothetical protein FRB94_003939 [Tulasnella sp. JGI-2019a]